MIKNLNDLIENLRNGKITGRLNVEIDNKGKINNLSIKRMDDQKEIESEIAKVKLKTNALQNVNFSGMNVSGSNFGGLSLEGSNFSYSKIFGSDLSETNLQNANFYRAHISQTNMSNSYGIKSLAHSYLTGSVNLYNVGPSSGSQMTNPYDGIAESQAGSGIAEDKTDISRLLIHKRNY
ncbi:MAG: pentapeptide repeat-containing protein [Nanoarchaeota archaeon]